MRLGSKPAGMSAEIAAALREIGARIEGPRTTAPYAPLFPKEPCPNVSAEESLSGPVLRFVRSVESHG
jgi:hypothetical protein